MTTVFMDPASLVHCCGVDEAGGFTYEYGDAGAYHVISDFLPPGAGMFVSTFVNNEVCRDAYEELCSRHKLLWQSPVMYNNNSGNELFLCVFMHKDYKSEDGDVLPY